MRLRLWGRVRLRDVGLLAARADVRHALRELRRLSDVHDVPNVPNVPDVSDLHDVPLRRVSSRAVAVFPARFPP